MKNRIKILYLYNHLRYGGAEIGLLTTLKYIDRNRFDCSVVSIEKRGAVGEMIEKIGVKVTYLNTDSVLYNLTAIFRVLKILKCQRPDILHTSLFYSNFFGRMAALFLFRGRPVVITEERSMYTEKRFYHILIDNLLERMTDKIIACSRSVIDFTVRQERIPENKFYLIYNAVDSDRFNVRESKGEIKKRYHIPETDFVIGTVGSVIPKKGHKFLIEACGDLVKEIPNLKVIIAGGGENRRDLEGLARITGIAQKVQFFDFGNEIPELMKVMDVFVLPSLQEGFPRTLIEAMYMGIAVCASNISGIPEIVRDGENGFLLDPGDPAAITKKIISLYADANLRNRLGSNARKTIESGYLPRDYLESLEGLYSKLCDRGGMN